MFFDVVESMGFFGKKNTCRNMAFVTPAVDVCETVAPSSAASSAFRLWHGWGETEVQES